jgi:hypothetical protein
LTDNVELFELEAEVLLAQDHRMRRCNYLSAENRVQICTEMFFLLRPFESLASYLFSLVTCDGASFSPSPTMTFPTRHRSIPHCVLDGGGREDDSLMFPCDHDRDVLLVS